MSAVSASNICKILVVGDIGSGKTSVIKRYVHNLYSSHWKSTIGVDFAKKDYQIEITDLQGVFKENMAILQFWDIAGQERFANMTRVYYKEAIGALVVCDVTKPKALEVVEKWKVDIDTKVAFPHTASAPEPVPLPVVLLGNKVDLQTRAITRAQLQTAVTDMGFAGFVETSAKDDIGLAEAVDMLVRGIVEKTRLYPPPPEEESGAVTLSSRKSETSDCCF